MEHRRAPSYPVDEPARKRAKIPHEVFLTNLVGNHILVFVATLGMASHMILPVMSVPVISVLCLGYTLWRARRAKRRDDWYVMCHWQAAARFSWIFIGMLALLAVSATVAWFGYDRNSEPYLRSARQTRFRRKKRHRGDAVPFAASSYCLV